MEDLNFIIQNEDDRLNDISMEDIKGGLDSSKHDCCGYNTECNYNTTPPEKEK